MKKKMTPDMINNHNSLRTMKPLFAALELVVILLASRAARPMGSGVWDILQQLSALPPSRDWANNCAAKRHQANA
jgi:hypothetical protein